ncbi:MAG: acetate--CoA ligase family protein [Halobacteria archaeon]|nr:acetate--CoA ligase family protein [Halobacteria archaeon]
MLFDPHRIAVVGATDREGSIGRIVTANLLSDFEGEVIPVNPESDEVLGLRTYRDIGSIPGVVDLAVVALSPKPAVQAVKEAGEANVPNVVVLSAGFGETEGGETREEELRKIADEYGLNLVGPNSLGVISTSVGLNATFSPENASPGTVSVMSQSGAFVTAVLNWANDHGIGLNNVVSLGNKAVLDETDLLEYWGSDPNTEVIVAYLEEIEDGQRFIEIARGVTSTTPVVVLKGGRTDEGSKAVSSHTGSLGGNRKAYEAALEQAGAIQADTVEELFDFLDVLESQPLPETEDIGIVTNAGGPGVLATDAVDDSGLSVASLSKRTRDSLDESMPTEANLTNPVDILGDADMGRFERAIEVVVQDENVGAGIVLTTPHPLIDHGQLVRTVAELRDEYGKPIVVCLMGGEPDVSTKEVLREKRVPYYFDPKRAAQSIEVLAKYRDIKGREYERPTKFDVDSERVRRILGEAKQKGRKTLGVEALEILDAYGIPVPESVIVNSPDEAEEVVSQMEGPAVMKVVSPDIPHKSDIGGVKLGVTSEEAYGAYEDLVDRARKHGEDTRITGVQVQEKVDVESGVETIVGMNRDPQFGPLVMFGLGGIFVEVLNDASFRVAPVSEREAKQMVNGIESSPLLEGHRGREEVSKGALVECIQRVSQLVTDFPEISELDINPLVVGSEGVKAVDIQITLDLEAQELEYSKTEPST